MRCPCCVIDHMRKMTRQLVSFTVYSRPCSLVLLSNLMGDPELPHAQGCRAGEVLGRQGRTSLAYRPSAGSGDAGSPRSSSSLSRTASPCGSAARRREENPRLMETAAYCAAMSGQSNGGPSRRPLVILEPYPSGDCYASPSQSSKLVMVVAQRCVAVRTREKRRRLRGGSSSHCGCGSCRDLDAVS